MTRRPMIDLALYQPDIPQNVGAAMRLCACLDAPLHIIEPCSFPWVDRKIKQSAMDYYDKSRLTRHTSFPAFLDAMGARRLVLMSTKSSVRYTDFTFKDGDILLAGSESAGVPDSVHARADARILIPLQNGLRSLNVVNASAMILGEALRQTQWSL